MYLIITHNLTKRTVTFRNLEDIGHNRLNYQFAITLPEGMPDGEYTYQLYGDDNTPQGSGIMQIGDYCNKNTQRYNDTDRYITYGE